MKLNFLSFQLYSTVRLMNFDFDYWKFIAGLGIFLFGMFQLEDALKVLAGRSFKLFLRKHTKNRIKAVLSGTLVTAILQSSSVVSLMVLAFVGAGILEMKHALGVIFGSNLGTTFTGWIVATFGFKLNIESFSLPAIGIGTILMLTFSERKNIFNISRFVVGFGFLFMGLDFMKVSIEHFAENVDITLFAGYSVFVFLLLGLVLTAIVQSSSATLVIVLSALHSEVIDIYQGAAMVIGSNLGTSVTVILASVGGLPAKKKVALGQLLFNACTALIVFPFLSPALDFILRILNITDPLFSLVTFHSAFNLFGIIVFTPFIIPFARFIDQIYKPKKITLTRFIHTTTPQVPEAAIHSLEKEISQLLQDTIELNQMPFKIPVAAAKKGDLKTKMKKTFSFSEKSFSRKYEELKQLEGELIKYYVEIQNEPLDKESSERMNQLIACVRSILHSAKSIKNIIHNLEEFDSSANDFLFEQFNVLGTLVATFYGEFKHAIKEGNEETYFEGLSDLMRLDQKQYEEFLKKFYSESAKHHLSVAEVSTVLNVNREIYSSHKSIINAAKNLLLHPQRVEDFNDIPGYVHGLE